MNTSVHNITGNLRILCTLFLQVFLCDCFCCLLVCSLAKYAITRTLHCVTTNPNVNPNPHPTTMMICVCHLSGQKLIKPRAAPLATKELRCGGSASSAWRSLSL